MSKTKHKALVVSGGECTLQKDLIPFLKLCKEYGISVKLDSNGSNPLILQKIIDSKLVDFIAMDVKGKLEKYKEITGKALRPKLLRKSISIIKESGLPHQFRTTVVPNLIDIEDIISIKKEIDGLPTFQNFRASNTCIDKKYSNYKEYTDLEFEEFVNKTIH